MRFSQHHCRCNFAPAHHTGSCMDKAIARLNIEHFRKRLATETDETTRQTLLRLLAEEEAKLGAGTKGPPAERKRRG
jgi:hypothetical protein